MFIPHRRVREALLIGAAAVGLTIAGCSGRSSSLPATPALQTAASTMSNTAPPLADAVTTTAQMRLPAASPNGAYPSLVLSDHPNSYYQLNDTGSTLTDVGPQRISGYYGSSVKRGSRPITAGASTAAAFPGGGSYDQNGFAYTPPRSSFQSTRITLETWFSLSAPNATSHDLPLVVYGTVAHGVRYGLFIHGLGQNQQCLMYQQRNVQANTLTVLGKTRLAVGSIYHVVESSDGNTITTYVNGVVDSTSSYHGSIDYVSSPIADGLQIGGANQIPAYASASFPGTIAEVAVYGSPLSQSQVTSHFLAGQTAPELTENPANSDAFVDSIGINAHFDNPYSLYATAYPQVKNLLVASGIRHLRETVSFNDANYLTMMKDLAASGIRGSYQTQLTLTQSQITSFPSMVGASFEQYEAPNEQDDVGNPNWIPGCRWFQQNLYYWVKHNPNTAQYPVLAPSIVKLTDVEALGSLSSYVDAGNIHDYFGVFNPGTIGYGGYYPPFGNYGSIAYNVNLGRVISGTSKPMEATETGYGTVAGNPLTLDYRAHLRYMTRLFFEQFNGGIMRSYSYELMDEGGNAVFANFGLLQTNLTPKPAYTGIKSLITALKDPGSRFTTTPLSYQISGFTNNVHHTLLQKRNGSYVLAIWIEAPDWVTLNNAGGDIIVPSQQVSITTAKHFSSANMTFMDDNGNMSTVGMSWNGQSTSFGISDKVALITLNP